MCVRHARTHIYIVSFIELCMIFSKIQLNNNRRASSEEIIGNNSENKLARCACHASKLITNDFDMINREAS
jgi:hypothetical protein